MTKFYGSLNNRFEENRMFVDTITVGTGMTEYYWSDRLPYEVVEVKDQKHIKVRKMEHRHIGNGCMDNKWELFSNEKNPVRELTNRGGRWYWTTTVTSDALNDTSFERQIWFAHNNIDVDQLRKRGKITRYQKANVSFGVCEYYYDYEF